MLKSFTVDETNQDGPSCSQLVAVIGGNHEMVEGIVAAVGCGSSPKRLFLDNKYYTCAVDIKCFRTSDELTNWDRNSKAAAEIGAIIVRYMPDTSPSILQEVARDMHLFQSTISLIVLDDEDSVNGAVRDKIQEWAIQNDFEIVVLRPSDDSIEEIRECHEKYGYERIAETLSMVNWPKKTMKNEPRTGNVNADHVLAALERIGPESSDDEDWEPNQRDLDAIWTTFAARPAFDFKKNSKVNCATAIVTVGDPNGDDIITQLSDRLCLSGESPSKSKESIMDDAEFERIMNQMDDGSADVLALIGKMNLLQRYMETLNSDDERRNKAGDIIMKLSQHIFDEED